MVKISSQEALNLKPVSLNVKQINVEKESASIWDGQDFGDSIGADSEIDNEEVTKLNKLNGVSHKEGKPSIEIDKTQETKETKDDGYIERVKKVLDNCKKQKDLLFDVWNDLYNKSKTLAYEYGYTRDIEKYYSKVTEPDLLELYKDMNQLEEDMKYFQSRIEKYEKILENAMNKDSSQ